MQRSKENPNDIGYQCDDVDPRANLANGHVHCRWRYCKIGKSIFYWRHGLILKLTFKAIIVHGTYGSLPTLWLWVNKSTEKAGDKEFSGKPNPPTIWIYLLLVMTQPIRNNMWMTGTRSAMLREAQWARTYSRCITFWLVHRWTLIMHYHEQYCCFYGHQ